METTPAPNPAVTVLLFADASKSLPTTQPEELEYVKATTNLLQQPELLDIIVSLLKDDRQALLSCARVSRDFNQACEYVIWGNLVVHGNPQEKGYIPVETLLAKASFVQSISVKWDTPAEFASLTFPRLRRLRLEAQSPTKQRSSWICDLNNLPAAIIQRHQTTLQELWLEKFPPAIEGAIVFWQTVGRAPGLETLGFQEIYISNKENTKVFWELCGLHSSLRELHLVDVHLDQASGAVGVFRRHASTLRTLVLDRIFADICFARQLCNLLEHSPELRTLDVGYTHLTQGERESYELPYDVDKKTRIVSILENGNNILPHLNRLGLELANFDSYPVDNILRSFSTTITDLSLAYSSFEPRCLHVLTTIFSTTLVSLNLRQCRDLTSARLHSILCACSSLKLIKADGLLASDLAASSVSWVCHDLEAWHMAIYMDTDEQTIHSQVFLRLSRLKKLRILDISHNEYSWIGDLPFISAANYDLEVATDEVQYYPALQLQYSFGMEQLQSLRNLSTLSFKNTVQVWQESDCLWIMDSFPRLTEIFGNVNKLAEKNHAFAELAKERRVHYCADD